MKNLSVATHIQKVLVLGYRKGLCQALAKQGIAYVLWDSKIKKEASALYTLHATFPATAKKIREIVTQLQPYGPFTHVLSGTESAVFPASVARRLLGARKSTDRLILRCHDKLRMKQALQGSGIAMTDYIHCTAQTTAAEVSTQLGLPVVVKERKQSGGKGTLICRDLDSLQQALKPNKIAERFINAEEASVESFIHNGEIQFANITQYYRKQHTNIVPALFDDVIKQQILQLNEKVIRHLNITRGMTHLEIYLGKNGLLFGEIALRPPGGYIMNLISLAYDFDAWAAYIATELNQPFHYPQTHARQTAVIILHPGPGRVSSISGLDKITHHPAVLEAKLKINIDEQIAPRTSSGKDVGYILLATTEGNSIVESIQDIEKQLQIKVE